MTGFGQVNRASGSPDSRILEDLALESVRGHIGSAVTRRHIGVNDHRRTLERCSRSSCDAKDPDLRAHSSKSVPMTQRHLTMAKQLRNQRDANSGPQREGQSGTQRAPQRN